MQAAGEPGRTGLQILQNNTWIAIRPPVDFSIRPSFGECRISYRNDRPFMSLTKSNSAVARRRTCLRHLVVAALFGLAAVGAGGTARAEDACRPLREAEHGYVVCSFDMREADLRLFWRGPDGKPFSGFAPLDASLRQHGERLAFAMNAGMFQQDLSPLGLYIEAGRQLRPANTRSGAGNFYMKPNGVFYVDGAHAAILETGRFLKAGLHASYATQSGPLLVSDGTFHPKIEATGISAKIRNGVGVRDGHIVIFAISEEPVTFFRFASLFRDRLGCPDALYLDGTISSVYAPPVEEAEPWLPIGPIVAVVAKAAP